MTRFELELMARNFERRAEQFDHLAERQAKTDREFSKGADTFRRLAAQCRVEIELCEIDDASPRG